MSREAEVSWEGEGASAWAARWNVPHLELHRALPSTNDRLRELAEAGASDFTTVIADEQTAGRGRQGRGWSSPAGKGLWMSLLLRAPCSDVLRISPILLGLAAARAIEEVAPSVSVGIKWPNDLVGSRATRFGKVGGILCESSGGTTVVAGIGINVSQRGDELPPVSGRLKSFAQDSGAPGAVRELPPMSLELLTGSVVDRARLAGALIREVRTFFQVPPAGKLPVALDGAVAEEVGRRDILAGQRVWLSNPLHDRTGGRLDPPQHEGVADGIDASGALRVLDGDGRLHSIISGSVRLIS